MQWMRTSVFSLWHARRQRHQLVCEGVRQCVDVLLSMLCPWAPSCPARRAFGRDVRCDLPCPSDSQQIYAIAHG